SLGSDLFSGGNVGSLFKQFPEQHICNNYCKWYKLGKVTPSPKTPTPDQSTPSAQPPKHYSVTNKKEE
ncbi:hypothetical protein FRC07_012073, partial [Ceratobasidium sp. 392]